jgi:ribonuclease HI
MENLIVYSDGSCTKTHCGAGIFIPKYNIKKLYILKENGTNQRAELTGVLYCIYEAQKIYSSNKFNNLIIRSDSIYSIKCVSEWYPKWIRDKWMRTKKEPVKNKDIITEILSLMYICKFEILFEHVKAHQKEPEKNTEIWEIWYGNMIADKIACNKS